VNKLEDNDSSGDERSPLPRRIGIRGAGFGGGAAGGVGNDVSMRSRGSDGENSDEDTEDARSSDEEYPREESFADIKEQMYQDKVTSLKTQLHRLKEGDLPDYSRKIKKLDLSIKESTRFREVAKAFELEQLESEYVNEKKLAVKELEERKVELRENLLSELEDKKRMVESERQSLDLTGTASSMRLMTSLYDPMDPLQKPVTRTLRKRTAETRNAQPNSKRMKNGQPAINYLLDDEDIAEDLKIIQKALGQVSTSRPPASTSTDVVPSTSGAPSNSTNVTSSNASQCNAPNTAGIRIENGKLYYDKKWFHRGQPVFLETPQSGNRDAGVIMAIIPQQDIISIRKLDDRTKVKIHLGQLAKLKYIIRKRTP